MSSASPTTLVYIVTMGSRVIDKSTMYMVDRGIDDI